MSDVRVDPLRALWQHLGAPVLSDLSWKTGLAWCARCTTPNTPTVRLVDVISDKFTGWDDYATGEREPRWCGACAWGHVEPTLRHYPWFITSTDGGQATPGVLRALLSSPLDPDTALIVPLSRKKHLLPAARFGQITTDDVRLPWTAADANRLPVLLRLHALGFSETALLASTPRFEHLRTLTPPEQGETLHLWPLLNAWRTYSPLMQVALRATRKDHAERGAA